MKKVIEIAVMQDLLPENILQLVELQVVCPPVVTRQADKQTQRFVMLHDKGLLSKRTWSAKEDLDLEHENQNFKEEATMPNYESASVKPENEDQSNDPSQQPESDVTRK